MSDDPCDWKEPDGDPAAWSDADWLRSMARANLIAEDIARADRIAKQLEAAGRLIDQAQSGAILHGLSDLDSWVRGAEAWLAEQFGPERQT